MKSSLVGLVLLLALSCSQAEVSLDFRVNPSVVDPTRIKEMTLSCTANQYNGQTNVSSLIILKNSQSNWRLVAQITDLEPDKVYVKDSNVNSHSGFLKPGQETAGALKLTWKPVSSETLGEYKCYSSSYTTDQNQITTTESKVNIGSQLDALAILRVMKSDKEEIEEKLGSLEDRTERYEQELKAATDEELSKLKEKLFALELDLNTTLADQEKSFELLQTQVDALFQKSQRNHSERLADLESRVQHVLDRGFLLLWPRGSYALPQPKSGCPSSARTAFVPGYRRHYTESNSRNKDQVSEGNHLQPPVLERQSSQNYVYQRFCVKNDRLSPGPVWPAGTYCINKMEACPLFFEEGNIKWTDGGKGGESTASGAVPNGQYTEASTRLFYCCRKDGAVDEPVDLPRAQPFYLYRFGGKCQQVNGMSVTEETIRFDTVNVNNSDEAVDPHPDAEINDVVLHLCYYQQI